LDTDSAKIILGWTSDQLLFGARTDALDAVDELHSDVGYFCARLRQCASNLLLNEGQNLVGMSVFANGNLDVQSIAVVSNLKLSDAKVRRQLPHTEPLDSARRELDGECDPVQPTADIGDDRCISGGAPS